jgi:transcriptional regulator with XRE-family HTH domain
MSQAELARRVEISKTAMNDIEQGRTKDPGFSVIDRIAKALNVSLDVFASEKDEVCLPRSIT